MELREATPTADAILAGVKEGVAAIVRDALAEAERLRSEADEKLRHYDGTIFELARLRLEQHDLAHEAAEIPGRLHVAKLDSLVGDGVGEDAASLQTRYMA